MTFKFSSLRTALLLPFVGLVAAVALAISGLSYVTGMRAVKDFSEQILSDVTHRVSQATTQHFAVPKLALNSVAPDATTVLPGASASVADIAPQSFEAIEQRLWLTTGLFSNVSGYVYFGAADGRCIGVNRGSAGTEVRVKTNPDQQRVAYRSAGPGLRGDELRRDDYDPRTRPWYKAAIAANGFAWSPIYVAATSKALTLTLAKPVYNAKNELLGVVATDIPLQSLDQFAYALKTSANGVVFIVDSNGDLVATSSA
ncbi:MAG: cache domain-containing protein, partial [Casimicrobium sp.]